MALKQGSISIDTENIFPIIKKWLYSDKDIFIRELISNGCDAVSKHKRLVALGEVNSDDKPYKITVAVSKKNNKGAPLLLRVFAKVLFLFYLFHKTILINFIRTFYKKPNYHSLVESANLIVKKIPI